MCSAKWRVRFTPESGHVRCNSICPLSANSGHQSKLRGPFDSRIDFAAKRPEIDRLSEKSLRPDF